MTAGGRRHGLAPSTVDAGVQRVLLPWARCPAGVTIQSEVMDMRALVVVESSFGNTRSIATASDDRLSRYMAVDVCDIGNAPSAIEDDVDLVVVGGPTHAL